MPSSAVSIRPPIIKRLGGFIAALNLRRGLLRFVALSNGLILLSLLWMLIVPESSMGVLRFVQEDMGVPRDMLIGLLCLIFFMDISHSLRGVSPGYSLLTILSGQFVLTGVTLAYTLLGKLSFIALYGQGGMFVLSVVAIVVVVQSAAPPTPYAAKQFIYPIISVLMAVLAVGLVTRPDTAIAQFIQTRYGLLFLLAIVGLLAWGSGQLRRNHLAPDQMIRRLVGVYLFTAMSIGLYMTDPDISLLGVTSNILVAALTIFFAFFQAQAYAGDV